MCASSLKPFGEQRDWIIIEDDGGRLDVRLKTGSGSCGSRFRQRCRNVRCRSGPRPAHQLELLQVDRRCESSMRNALTLVAMKRPPGSRLLADAMNCRLWTCSDESMRPRTPASPRRGAKICAITARRSGHCADAHRTRDRHDGRAQTRPSLTALSALGPSSLHDFLDALLEIGAGDAGYADERRLDVELDTS